MNTYQEYIILMERCYSTEERIEIIDSSIHRLSGIVQNMDQVREHYFNLLQIEASEGIKDEIAKVKRKVQALKKEILNYEMKKLQIIEERMKIEMFIFELPFTYIDIISKRYKDKMCWDTISSEMGMSLSYVKKLNGDAYEQLKPHLQDIANGQVLRNKR